MLVNVNAIFATTAVTSNRHSSASIVCDTTPFSINDLITATYRCCSTNTLTSNGAINVPSTVCRASIRRTAMFVASSCSESEPWPCASCCNGTLRIFTPFNVTSSRPLPLTDDCGGIFNRIPPKLIQIFLKKKQKKNCFFFLLLYANL